MSVRRGPKGGKSSLDEGYCIQKPKMVQYFDIHTHAMTLSPAWKQFLGAALGMTVATVAYVAVQQGTSSTEALRAYLVTPGGTIVDSAGVVATNARSPDSETLRRLQRRAQEVAQMMYSSSVSPSVRADLRREERIAEQVRKDALAQAPEYPATQAVVSQYERLQQRTARVAEQPDGLSSASLSSSTATIHAAASAVDPVTTESAPMIVGTDHAQGALPGAGATLTLSMLVALVGAAALLWHRIAERRVAQ